MKKAILVILFFIFCSAVSYSQEQDCDNYLAKAYECLNEGRLKQAQMNYEVYRMLDGIIDHDFEARLKSLQTAPDNMINGHEYVDLGLPSGTKWATCNVGASSPEDCGEYFAWGEVRPKNIYCSANCIWWNKRAVDIAGKEQYDIATRLWGQPFCMPSKRDIEELINNVTSVYTVSKGISGLLITSKINGKSIFLPACGYRLNDALSTTGKYGGYWSSTPDDEENKYAFSIIIDQEDGLGVNWYGRNTGFCIRPVVKTK